MRWHEVVPAVVGEVEGDADLLGLFGTSIYRSGDRDLTVPSLEFAVISDVENERFNPIRIQWTVFVRRDEELVLAEQRLRALFSHDLPTEIGGLKMWSEYAGREEVPGLQDGIRGSSTDFVYTPIRSRYVRAESES